MKSFQIILLVVGLALPSFAFGDNVQIDASLDTGYFDQLPTRNFGAHTHVPVGQANNLSVRRALFHMDIAASIPAGSTINAVTFQFDVTQQGGGRGQQGSTFELHRVTNAWTEGTGVGNLGSDPGDGATWDNRTAVDLWTTPGGDFAGASSGSVFIDHVADGGGTITYSLGNAQLITDVQDILDNGGNFGFLLKADTENLAGSAMRVTTREEANGALGSEARLIIDFTPPAGTQEVNADSFSVSLGSVSSGGLSDIAASDNQYLVLDPVFLTFRYQLIFTVDATSPTETPSGFEFSYESRAINFVGTVEQKIELFNYDTGGYETVDSGFAAGTDTVVSVDPGGDPTRFVQSGTGAMQARISYQNSFPFWVFSTENLYLPYRVRADHVFWSITP